MTPLDCVKDPVKRGRLQSMIGQGVHQFKGRKTKREKELDQDTDSESEVEEEEPFEGYYQDTEDEEDEEEDEDEEWEDEEEEEEEVIHHAYSHSFSPREVTQINATTKCSPGPFHKEVDLWQP